MTALQKREWLVFSYPDGSGWEWHVDVTFLMSGLGCIWKAKGDPTPGPRCPGTFDTRDWGGCCADGAYFADEEDYERTVKRVAMLTPEEWQQHKLAQGRWDAQWGHERSTRVRDKMCVFYNKPGFEGGEGCAFHIAALNRGEPYIEWKPDACWMVPIRVEHDDDEEESYLYEYHHEQWSVYEDDPRPLDWWCCDSQEAYEHRDPLYVRAETELRAILGDEIYEELKAILDQRPRNTRVKFLPLIVNPDVPTPSFLETT